MGKRDVYTKPYMSDPQRVAELLNVTFYKGQQIVNPQKLRKQKGSYPSIHSMAGEKARDVFYEEVEIKKRFAIELETKCDYSMPERVMVYDASDYEEQIHWLDKRHREQKEYKTYEEMKSRLKSEDRLTPVVTLVLYLGEGKWNGPRSLKEMYWMQGGPNENEEEIIQDYKIHVVETDTLNALAYETDLREFFQALQCRKDKRKLMELFRTERFKNLNKDAEIAIAVNLNWNGLIERIEKEEIKMCQAIEEWRMELLEEGREEGIEKGIKETIKVLIETCKELGVSKSSTIDRIRKKLSLSLDESEEYVKIYW